MSTTQTFYINIEINRQDLALETVKKIIAATFEKLKAQDQKGGERFILTPEEIASEQWWNELFADPRSEQLLEELSQKALMEYQAGRTRELDPDEL